MVRDHFDLMTIIETKVNQETFNKKKKKINIQDKHLAFEGIIRKARKRKTNDTNYVNVFNSSLSPSFFLSDKQRTRIKSNLFVAKRKFDIYHQNAELV